MSITYKLVDILNGIGGGGSCTKSWCTNIECVCTMVYCLAPKLKVFSRSKKFKGHIVI